MSPRDSREQVQALPLLGICLLLSWRVDSVQIRRLQGLRREASLLRRKQEAQYLGADYRWTSGGPLGWLRDSS